MALNHEEIGKTLQVNSFISKYNSKGIKFPSEKTLSKKVRKIMKPNQFFNSFKWRRMTYFAV